MSPLPHPRNRSPRPLPSLACALLFLLLFPHLPYLHHQPSPSIPLVTHPSHPSLSSTNPLHLTTTHASSSSSSFPTDLTADWQRVISTFLTSVTASDIRTAHLLAAHSMPSVRRTCALLTLRHGHLSVNATGLLRKYLHHGRFVSLPALLLKVLHQHTSFPTDLTLTALIDVSDGSFSPVATLSSARHWIAWKNIIPVPLGNPRGGDSGSATPVLGWDTYIERHVLNRWTLFPWHRKEHKAVFRGALRMQKFALGSCNGGRLSRCKNASSWTQVNRGVLYQVGKFAPDVVDVAFTEILPHPSLGPAQLQDAPTVVPGFPFVDFQRFKIVINVGSNHDWAERLRGLMFMNSIVLHHQAETQEFFTPLLRPWYNMIPFSLDMTNLVNTVRYVLSNDQQARVILHRQNQFAQRYLTEDAMLEYWRVLLVEYARRQRAADAAAASVGAGITAGTTATVR